MNLAHQGHGHRTGIHLGDDAAVLGRGIGHVIRRLDTAGAGTVLHDHLGIARNVLADMARHQLTVEVEGAAATRRNDHGDRLALIEILHAGRGGRGAHGDGETRRRAQNR